jgi:CRISPR-associated protein Cas2
MTVLVANDTPPAIRGMLKRWFVEPKPNVFVGTVNRRTRDKVLDYVKHNAQGLLRRHAANRTDPPMSASVVIIAE